MQEITEMVDPGNAWAFPGTYQGGRKQNESCFLGCLSSLKEGSHAVNRLITVRSNESKADCQSQRNQSISEVRCGAWMLGESLNSDALAKEWGLLPARTWPGHQQRT